MCKDAIFTALQYILPHHAFSRIVGLLAETKNTKIKNMLIEACIKRYKVNLSEAASENLDDYENFNAFFTRELKPGLRPFPTETTTLASPADGVISKFGKINEGKLIQAKGINYGIFELLGGEYEHILDFKHGIYSTIYLAPRDYHRVHIPMKGKHVATTYVPGRLFSVNPATTSRVDGLFTRNERVVLFFETDHGKMAVVLVGAMLVAGIETVTEGLITPPHKSDVVHYDYSKDPKIFNTGDEIGRFKFGSTAIVLHENRNLNFLEALTPNSPIVLGAPISTLN